jgi:DNA-directed RNA polymerase II subunit RPB2
MSKIVKLGEDDAGAAGGGIDEKPLFNLKVGGAPKKRAAAAAVAPPFQMDDKIAWSMIERYFHDEPHNLVKHHTESFSDFYKHGIFEIFRKKNPITIYSKLDPATNEYKNRVDLYFGGKNGDKIYFGKPTIYDDNNSHFMFPNEARLRNMNYGMSIHYDVEYEVTYRLDEGETPHVFYGGGEISIGGADDSDDEEVGVSEGGAPTKGRKRKVVLPEDLTPNVAAQILAETKKTLETSGVAAATAAAAPREQKSEVMTLSRVFLGKFPVMLQSDFCVLSGLTRENRFYMGECRNDYGGYFIIDGKEKVIIPQEKFGNNMMYVEHTNDEKYLYLAKIRSVSENASKPVRTLKIGVVSPSARFTNKQIVVEVPNVRKPVPLFILFRALGVTSDRAIIEHCMDIKKNESMLDLFIPSVHDSAAVMTQESALEYLRTFVKGQNLQTVLHVLADYFLPHVGELNFKEKALHLGHMVLQLMLVYSGAAAPTDRDNFKFKRVDTTGDLLYELFNEYYTIQQKYIALQFEKKVYFAQAQYEDNLTALIQQNYQNIFKERIVETGFRKAYKGNWGATAHTKRLGIVQDLNRLSYFSALNHMRKITLPLDTTSKVVGPRLLNSTQWGLIDPIDTPDGGNIGLHKHLTIGTCISRHIPRDKMVEWLVRNCKIELLENVSVAAATSATKIFVNGYWVGIVENPEEIVLKIRLFRRNGLIPLYISATFEIKTNTVFVMCDSGRLCRPIFYRDEIHGKMSYESSPRVIERIEMGGYTWDELTMGFNTATAHGAPQRRGDAFYDYADIFGLPAGGAAAAADTYDEKFYMEKAVIEYIDTSEEENTYISLSQEQLTARHTHLEIHKSLIFGLMCNMIVFPENNPATRNSFSCGQSKQACSLYSTNYQIRMDKMGVLLNYGQVPLVKTRYLDLINREENVYGENAIVAIMCYTGYNVEDAILINQGSIERGMFQTTYFTVYQAHEEAAGVGGAAQNINIANIEAKAGSIVGTKSGFDYSYLDEYGLIKEGTPMNDRRIVIGMMSPHGEKDNIYVDGSIVTKKGQLGVVDKTFITDNAEGSRIAKVRVVEQRMPGQGDKFASRAGQKGTIGLIIPEHDMPFTRDGLRPDLIINPHALPTRQTIGQLVEALMGKATLIYGGFGDGTAFMNTEPKFGTFGELLTKQGFHSSGNEILYNGMTGEQIESEIYIGPTYYMRLKHMVKDKINYRARGPKTMLTRQPVQGRANDGGLRVGEMEANSIMGHGAMEFLNDAMMNRSDKYKLAVCNKTGMIAVYNPERNLFLSPAADGPLKFSGNVDDLRLETVTRFGRDFSIVEVPYCFKLLIQELATINVQMRIITEDNIAQMENLMFGSHSIERLTQLNDPGEVIEIARKIVRDDADFASRALAKIVKEAAPGAAGAAAAAPEMRVRRGRGQRGGGGEDGEDGDEMNMEVAGAGAAAATPEADKDKHVSFIEGGGELAAAATEAAPAQDTEFNVGDKIYMLGSSGEPWSVKTVRDDFLTVVQGDKLEVVDKKDVYKDAPQQAQAGGGAVMPVAGAAMQQPVMVGGGVPPINIKFVGGSDFSISREDNVVPASAQMGGGVDAAAVAVQQNIDSLLQNNNLLRTAVGGGGPSVGAPPVAEVAAAPAPAPAVQFGGKADGEIKVLKLE